MKNKRDPKVPFYYFPCPCTAGGAPNKDCENGVCAPNPNPPP